MLSKSRKSPSLRHLSIRGQLIEERRENLWGQLRSGLRLTVHNTQLSKVTLTLLI